MKATIEDRYSLTLNSGYERVVNISGAEGKIGCTETSGDFLLYCIIAELVKKVTELENIVKGKR